jgi:hypothetical protein
MCAACRTKGCYQKKAKKMCYECDDDFCSHPQSDESKQRSYLSRRLNDLEHSKQQEAMKTFGLVDDDAPVNVKELIERILAKQYVLDEKKVTNRGYYNLQRGLRWRNPDLKEDQAGYDAFWSEFTKKQTATQDAISILPPADGLKALQEFEAWTPTGKAN